MEKTLGPMQRGVGRWRENRTVDRRQVYQARFLSRRFQLQQGANRSSVTTLWWMKREGRNAGKPKGEEEEEEKEG